LPLLAFDTAQGALSVAVFDGDRVLAHHHELRSRGHAEELMGVIGQVLRSAGLAASDLSALAVTIGPGTFTGLRVGLAAARGLALARTLPLVGVTTLEAVAAPVVPGEDELIAVAFDARRSEIYLQAFDARHMPVCEPAIIGLDTASDMLPTGRFVLAGTGAALLADALEARGIFSRLSECPAQPDAREIGRIALARLHAHGLDHFRKAPTPLYLRAPDAKLPGGLDPVLGA
tara:strand:+ start:135141 stop:135836 length:696 start_codon:yes stop_codon:yes gene_type:complete